MANNNSNPNLTDKIVAKILNLPSTFSSSQQIAKDPIPPFRLSDNDSGDQKDPIPPFRAFDLSGRPRQFPQRVASLGEFDGVSEVSPEGRGGDPGIIPSNSLNNSFSLRTAPALTVNTLKGIAYDLAHWDELNAMNQKTVPQKLTFIFTRDDRLLYVFILLFTVLIIYGILKHMFK